MNNTMEIRRANERFHTQNFWLNSFHNFSFGNHYDPGNIQHGLLLVSNDDRVRPGTGFRTHPHQDMEIVTWVLSGELEHKDSLGNGGIIYPGLAQRMSAGTGILHSEMNATNEEVHFVQMWVLPDTERITPGYQQMDINSELDKGGLIPIASGKGHDAAISIRQKGAVLWGGRLKPGETVTVPDGKFVHIFIASGGVLLENAGPLNEGDSIRMVAGGPQTLKANNTSGSEVLIWQTD